MKGALLIVFLGLLAASPPTVLAQGNTPVAPVLQEDEAAQVVANAALFQGDIEPYLLRYVSCRRSSPTSFRCAFLAGPDVGVIYRGRGVVSSAPGAAADFGAAKDYAYDLRGVRFRTRVIGAGRLVRGRVSRFAWSFRCANGQADEREVQCGRPVD